MNELLVVKSYLLRVELLHTHRPVWREFRVPSDISLSWLHEVIQEVMGWEDAHMHFFKFKKRRFESSEFASGYDFWGTNTTEAEEEVLLSDLLKRARQKLSYTYDFGDNWAHSVTLMKQVAYDPDLAFKCVAGEGACPLEDCGGVYGHQRISEYVKTGVDDGFLPYDDRELGEYDPDLFDMNEVNGLLHNVKEEYREDEDRESGAIYLSNPVGTGDGPVVPLFRSVCLWRLWRVHRSRILKLI